MSAATVPQQQPSLNTPGFFASAFLEMNIFEQCFSAAAPSDPKDNNASTAPSSGSINTTSSSSSTAAPAQGAHSSRSLNTITPVSAPHAPPLSPKSTTMDSYNPGGFVLPTIFSGVDPTGPSCGDMETRYGQDGWPTHLDTAVVPPSAIQPRLSPPYSSPSGSPTDRFMAPVEMDDTMSPLHNMLVNYPTETRSAHGQITPPEDPTPLTPGQQGERMFGDDGDCFNEEYTIIADTNHSSSGNGQTSAEADSNSSSRGSAGAIGRPRTRTNNRSSTNRRTKGTSVEDDSAKEAKRQKFLERNRIAASKCRRKKKQWTQNLEDTAREVQAASKNLNNQVTALRDELLHLKGELLKHNGCSCERIKQYLMNEATRVVEGSSASANASNAAVAAAAAAATANLSSSNNTLLHQTSQPRQMSQGSDLGFSAQFDDLSDTSSARFAMGSRSPEDTGVGMSM